MTSLFPPANYVPAGSTIPGIQLFKPAPLETPEKHQTVVQFHCPQCNGTTAYNATDGGLTCTFCGYHEGPAKGVIGKAAQEFEFTAETVEQATQGWGVERKVVQCQNCGAETIVAPDSLTNRCPFCASNQVIQQKAPQDLLRPRFLIPFALDQDKCHSQVRAWLGNSWMTPGSLAKIATFAEFSPVFLPFWTFDATTTASWKAEVAHTETESYYDSSDKEWKTRTKITWKWESGHVRLPIDDLLVAGSTKISQLLLARVQDYNLNELTGYDPTYLVGLQAQAYDLPLPAVWEQGRELMREQTKTACKNQASNSKMRNFSMSLAFQEERWRYVLLPVYVAAYRYGDKGYQLLVNGQNGTVAGQRPVSWGKIGLAVLAMFSPSILVGLVGLLLFLAGVGALLCGIAFLLFVLGVIGSYWLVSNAQTLDDV